MTKEIKQDEKSNYSLIKGIIWRISDVPAGQEGDWTGGDMSEETRSVGQARAEVFCAASRPVRRLVRPVMRPRRGVSTSLTPTVPRLSGLRPLRQF